MVDEVPKLVDFYRKIESSPAQQIETKPTSISTQREEVTRLVAYVKKRLPSLHNATLEKLAAFLISAPVLPKAQNLSGDEITKLNFRSTDATAIAEKLIEAGFGTTRDQSPLALKPNQVINLATLLISAPPAGDKIAERSFKRDFAQWKGQFAIALQGIQSRTESTGRKL
jgi:hypothetical protein